MMFHLSPTRNRRSILREGLSLAYCLTTRQAIHCVNSTLIDWAAEHVAKRHGVTLDELDLWMIDCHFIARIQRSRRGKPYAIPAGILPAELAGYWPWRDCSEVLEAVSCVKR